MLCSEARRASDLGDVSLRGDWTCFRNEFWFGSSSSSTSTGSSASFLPISRACVHPQPPNCGKLQFDFFSSHCQREPHTETETKIKKRTNLPDQHHHLCISDKKCVELIAGAGLIPPTADTGTSSSSSSAQQCEYLLRVMKCETRRSNSSPLGRPYWCCDVARASQISEYINSIDLSRRSDQVDRIKGGGNDGSRRVGGSLSLKQAASSVAKQGKSKSMSISDLIIPSNDNIDTNLGVTAIVPGKNDGDDSVAVFLSATAQ